MFLYHDPLRQENYLQQCLAHDKKPIGLLLGQALQWQLKIQLRVLALLYQILQG